MTREKPFPPKRIDNCHWHPQNIAEIAYAIYTIIPRNILPDFLLHTFKKVPELSENGSSIHLLIRAFIFPLAISTIATTKIWNYSYFSKSFTAALNLPSTPRSYFLRSFLGISTTSWIAFSVSSAIISSVSSSLISIDISILLLYLLRAF